MRRFWADQKGNVAIIFALAIIPIFGAVGAALDYSVASAQRTDLQKALDATALALSKIMPADQATLDSVGNQYFQANLGNHSLENLQLTITPAVGTLKVSATGTYHVSMAHLIGASTMELGASAEVKWNIGKVEIALVLDNSGSMSSYSRMTRLKEAAHNLLDVLENAAREPDDAKVAIVPFDSRVNVGIAYASASWLRWGVCSPYGCGPSNATNWNGCVWDRDKSNDISDQEPTTSNSTKYPAFNCEHGLSYPGRVVQMLPLTTDWNALHDRVNQMEPAGYTNITIGLVWGWHALSPTPLFTEGVAYDTENLTKYIILMTDGDNTRNRFGDGTSTMNDRTSGVCTAIKNAGVKIYSIRLVSGNATLLRNCASDPSMYYDVQDSNDLIGVFGAIGQEIANLHLSK